MIRDPQPSSEPDNVEMFMRHAGTKRLLAAEEEARLARRIAAGDPPAKEQMMRVGG
jgi:DNA-directed RNA polymerase sigma subunit (sigma70/sigma32)